MNMAMHFAQASPRFGTYGSVHGAPLSHPLDDAWRRSPGVVDAHIVSVATVCWRSTAVSEPTEYVRQVTRLDMTLMLRWERPDIGLGIRTSYSVVGCRTDEYTFAHLAGSLQLPVSQHSGISEIPSSAKCSSSRRMTHLVEPCTAFQFMALRAILLVRSTSTASGIAGITDCFSSWNAGFRPTLVPEDLGR